MIQIKEVKVEDDLDKIVTAISNSSWSENSEIDPSDYSVDDLRKCISSEANIFCIAFLDEQFAGMASAFVLHKPDGDTWLYVDEVDVCADKQKKGVGKAIMQFLLEYGKDNDCDEIWLGTEKDNVAANALYKSLQPTEVENFVGYLYK